MIVLSARVRSLYLPGRHKKSNKHFTATLAMPTYDYLCDNCGHKFELFQSITESQKRKCPECKKHKLRRLFGTGAAIVFKGSGFYENRLSQRILQKGRRGGQEGK